MTAPNITTRIATLVNACEIIVDRWIGRVTDVRAFVDAYNALSHTEMTCVKHERINEKHSSLSTLVNKTVNAIVARFNISSEVILRELPRGVVERIGNIVALVVSRDDMAALAFWVKQAININPIQLNAAAIDAIYNHPRRDEVARIILSTVYRESMTSMFMYTFIDDLAGFAKTWSTGNRDLYKTSSMIASAVKLGRVSLCKYVGDNSNSYMASIFIADVIQVISRAKKVVLSDGKVIPTSIDCISALFKPHTRFTVTEASSILMSAIESGQLSIIDVCLDAIDTVTVGKAIAHITENSDSKENVESMAHIVQRGYAVSKEVMESVLQIEAIDAIRKVMSSPTLPYTIYVSRHTVDMYVRVGIITRDVRKKIRWHDEDDTVNFRDIQSALVGISVVGWATDIAINAVM